MSKALADTHVPPAVRRWGARLGLALVVATTIGYIPGRVLARDPRTTKLNAQLAELAAESQKLRTLNTELIRDITALQTDVHAIEDRARADLGMVYPDEIVLRVVTPDEAARSLAATAKSKSKKSNQESP